MKSHQGLGKRLAQICSCLTNATTLLRLIIILLFEVDKLDISDSRNVIEKLKMQFSQHGIPEVVISDNGPQYASTEFAKFASDWHFQHITSSPWNPQSNGKRDCRGALRMPQTQVVRTVKQRFSSSFVSLKCN